MKIVVVILFALFANTLFGQTPPPTDCITVYPAKMVFQYDDAGNQTVRYYCNGVYPCSPPDQNTPFIEESSDDYIYYDNLIRVYPNPTNGIITLDWDNEISDLIESISITGLNIAYREEVSFDKLTNKVSFDLTDKNTGYFLVSFYLSDGLVIDKKIIKL